MFYCWAFPSAVRDMQQVYDMWLALAAQSKQAEEAPSDHSNFEERCIIMPTDYADQLVSEARRVRHVLLPVGL